MRVLITRYAPGHIWLIGYFYPICQVGPGAYLSYRTTFVRLSGAAGRASGRGAAHGRVSLFISNVVLMGVHMNMCVLGRPFGIRQMVRLGKNVVLARDLTDAMYDPRQPPYVSHARGTELVVEHIERYWCPSILGADLTRVTAGTAGPLQSPAVPVREK